MSPLPPRIEPLNSPDPRVLQSIDVMVAALLRERDEALAIVRDLAEVYTVETDQIAVLSLVARARTAVSERARFER